MKNLTFIPFLLCTLASVCAHSTQAQDTSEVPYADCAPLAKQMFGDLMSGETPEQAADSFLKPAKHLTCFASTLPSISRTSVLKALIENLASSKQQSTPSGSSGSTSSVSKPAGSTSIIQDVGGVSATSNGSALTLQFAPGDLVELLSNDGVFDFCTSTIKTQGCWSPTWLKVFIPATFSVTTNTTTPSSTVSGVAMSTGTAVPITLNSASNTLSFGGITAKYAFLYPKKDQDAVNKDLRNAAKTLADSLGKLMGRLAQCDAYKNWPDKVRPKAIEIFQQTARSGDQSNLEAFIRQSYGELSVEMEKDPSCNLGTSVQASLNTVSAYQTAIAVESVIAKSSTPLLGVEYDFTTPTSKPSYHSAKFNFSWQSSTSCNTQVKTAAAKALKAVSPKASLDEAVSASCSDASAGTDSKDVSAASTSATPSWTISASGGADINSDDPSITIPSASRLRDVQVGAEITRVWHISTYKTQNAALTEMLSKVGDLSLVGAYYYQDQTSPSILNGPPSTITFNGLPTAASQVYATRGPINVGQIRLGFGTGTNVRFPIAVSYSNRSDLIVHPFVGVQFGVSYDLFGK